MRDAGWSSVYNFLFRVIKMEYKKTRKKLLQLFKKNNFFGLVKIKNYHKKTEKVYTCSNASEIFVVYPGYKAKIKDGKIASYDFRVDIEKNGVRASLSHANIIVDIYNKCSNGYVKINLLEKVLVEISQEGEFKLNKYPEVARYKPCLPPTQRLLEIVEEAHKNIGRIFNKEGNKWDLNFEELLYSIKWIVIQEDLNYPIKNGFEGRKMPFARYMEAVYCCKNDKHRISEVIERALAHHRPTKWKGMDYSFLNNVR